ncbi:hypothetical protein [Halopiger aswanensis]|uniref:Uncharacterized protein n=1 Tax=Halopiger aswanensis TaxID=148449 RepID=A0A3R7GGP4_9EURY|nr:hypothetical protein [Halopiger aswanensis]RKD93478.1 hypothetical protein ATJ93_3102 [Halopiger aswanensis]
MNVELIALGVLVIALGVGVLSLARRFYPRLEFGTETMETIRLLTALIVGLLVLTGLGLIAVGIVVPSAAAHASASLRPR